MASFIIHIFKIHMSRAVLMPQCIVDISYSIDLERFVEAEGKKERSRDLA